MLEQPRSQGTEEDVERIVRRDFAAAEVDAAFRLLADYGNREGQPDPARVRLAALKYADGNLAQLERAMDSARYDLRDVLIRAEYPSNYRLVMRTRKASPEEYDHSIRKDWKQYNDWLSRSSPPGTEDE